MTTAQLREMGFEPPPPGERIARRVEPSRAETKSVVERPAIRMPASDRDQPNKTEQRFRDHFGRIWQPTVMLYEAVTLRLPSGTRYTPDWLLEFDEGPRLHVEVKGAHVHNSASIRAYKEAAAAFPFWRFLFAQWKGGEWLLHGFQPDQAKFPIRQEA